MICTADKLSSESIRKACEFLLSKQMEDGGWGESYKSCETGEYVHHQQSQVVQTAWALLGLMAAKYPQKGPIEKGIKLIMSRQQPNGEWLQEGIEGTRLYLYLNHRRVQQELHDLLSQLQIYFLYLGSRPLLKNSVERDQVKNCRCHFAI